MPSNFVVVAPSIETRGRKRQHRADRAATSTERMRAKRAVDFQGKVKRIAVLDFETDPFDPNTRSPVYPFTACLYSAEFEFVIWQENLTAFIDELMALLESIDEPYTIYAHNGGKFDFMFLIHKLRGRVSFKGRGLMAAKIGIHDLRDSTHILPMKLSDWKKDDFDYDKMKRDRRGEYKQEIIDYMINDCKALYEIVRAFILEFGFKLTIGQAAMAALKQHYPVKQIGEHTDEQLRPFFFGGRVECIQGAGHFKGDYKLYDVNSMYPAAMANFQHPVGNGWTWRRRGGINSKTAFIELRARNNPGGIGALITRRINPDSGEWETTASAREGTFRTTIHEFEAATELGLLSDVEVIQYVDCDQWSDFSKFIVPMYERRHETKAQMKKMRAAGVDEESPEYLSIKKEDIFLKFLLNNSYGKFAMNPRKFKEAYITDPGAPRPPGYDAILAPSYRCPEYDMWERPAQKLKFNNVGTAASITGAARSILLRGLFNATDPIYCDTDSIICRAIDNVEISDTELGAWKLEDSFDEVAIAGKKLYACRMAIQKDGHRGKDKVRSKGVREGALGWNDILRLIAGDTISVVASLAPAIRKTQEQHYIDRKVRRTAPILRNRERLKDDA
jgi:hypothetical protein